MLLIQLQSVQERLRLFNNPTTAIEVPEEETLKTTTSPVQTATGKDLTNPLRADALLKSINKDNTGLSSSLSLNSKLVYPSPSTFGKSKMTNLATNPLMQEPVFKPDYLKAAKQEEERYYVVFKGPRSGIYTTWGETQKICQEDKSTNKKFRTLEQAQMELRLYGEAKKTTPLLKPKAFRAGLINNIYPSNNLLEIKEFQSSVFETIKKFRTYVLKAQDKKIYIKVTSSIPDWNHEENYSPYHCMEIGLARKNEELQFSKAMEDKLQNPFLEVIKNQRVQSLKRISEIILQAITEENRKVNYADSHCIVISYKNEAEEQDIQLLTQYGIPFLTNTIDAASTTKEAFCKHAKQLFEEHSCIFCQDKSKEKDVGPSTTPKEPTTDEESS
ncbi:RNA-directed DNA polymerase, eukaryota, reverse transcriptase zinc-binding domain protein [Tanacetum coccineum]